MIKKDVKNGIIYHEWKARGGLAPRAVFLLVHGLGGHGGRWTSFADFFLKKGFSSYAPDLKGFGESSGPKGHIDSFNTYFEDIKRMRNVISSENGGKKIFLCGESAGGVITFLEAIRDGAIFDGLICVSPAFISRLKFSPVCYARIFSSALYNPRKEFNMPFDSGMCTRDKQRCEALDADRKEHRIATSGFLFNMAIAQIKSQFLAGKLKIPVLFLLSGNDALVDPRASEKIFKKLVVKDKKINVYSNMYHALSIDHGRERVFEDILAWTEGRL